ncbi:MAG: NAD(P)-dependent oxidoreductase, partial [Actinomycetota bacterium]|nr:NAD(P)-dependent oxidoreductase [Actinomycetota bacterium]
VAEHDERHRDALRYLKLGEGPFYTLIKNNIFVYLEIMKTVKRVVREGRGLLDNSARPSVGVAAVAKRTIEPGTKIESGIGSFDVRGVAVRIAQHPGHLPIGLLSQAVVLTEVAPDQMLTFEDVELPESLALRAWQEIESEVLASKRGIVEATSRG